MSHNIKRIIAASSITLFTLFILGFTINALLTDHRFRIVFGVAAFTGWLMWSVIYFYEHKWDGTQRIHTGPGPCGY